MLSWTNGTSLNFLGKRRESFELLSCVCLGRKVGLAQNPFYHTTKFSQLLPTTAIINVQGQERRNCILMLGFKGLGVRGTLTTRIQNDKTQYRKNGYYWEIPRGGVGYSPTVGKRCMFVPRNRVRFLRCSVPR